ncbi:MAG: LysM peptidoglycan-binding domain-containing protein [Thiotrichaceae bacterium]
MKLSLPLLSLTLLSVSVLMLQGCSTKYAKDTTKMSPVEVEYDAYYGQPERGRKVGSNRAKSGKGSQSTSPFRKNAPTRYVVKKGDTLWGISRKFLKDPSYWPEIWDKNQKVRNPHRIYPGDILFIHQGNGSMVSGGSNKLVPTIRVTRKGVGEPISTLAPFLSWPRVANKDDLTSAPYIIAARDATLLLEKDKDVYIKGLANARRGDTYGIYHTGKELRDIETDELLGTEISYHGQVAIVHPDDVTTATIEKSNREIRAGDRLIKVNPNPKALSMPITPPTSKIRGTVMSLYDADLISGQHMIAVINRGKRDGIRTGHILGIYSPPRLAKDPYEKRLDKWHSKQAIEVRLPPERVGSMIVYSVNERLSYALISKSDHHIKKGYKVGNP